jgi:hypothetical protein
VSGVLRSASALARSCHPAPSAGVTAFATVLAVTAGNGAGTCALLALAVLAGQLSIGWSNDRLDAARDRAVARTDKPIATGELAHRTVEVAIAVALAACVACSLALGWRAGLLHLAAVSCGWLYNLWLKATWFSWLPYAAAFGALPGRLEDQEDVRHGGKAPEVTGRCRSAARGPRAAATRRSATARRRARARMTGRRRPPPRRS